MEKRSFKDREKGAYQRLLQYELQQYAQEHTRETLGTPYGRAPPIKLYNLQEDTSNIRASDSSPVKDLSMYQRILEFSTSNDFSPVTLSKTERLLSRTLPKTQRLDPLLSVSLSARELSSRSGPLPQFPATQKPLSYSFHPSDILRKDSEYQFKAAFPEEIETFNPFQRPQADNYFFPPDMFLDEDLTQVISALPTEGLGKWRHTDGSCEWKPCQILAYYPETRIFEIQWNGSFARKGVTRLNLRFQGETESEFDSRCRKVREMRMNHEGFVRYFGRFELALANTFLDKSGHFLSGEAAILQKISYPFTSAGEEEDVKREIWDLYRRGVWKFIFDSQYFYEKVRLAACPWKDDLERQTRWINKLTYEAAEQPFKQLQRKVQEKYMNPKKLLDQSRLNIYKSLTAVRNGDYYHHLKGLQGLGYTLNGLNYKFRDCFATDLMRIDTVIKQIREFLLKTWEDNKSQDVKKAAELSDEVDRYFRTSQIILESNLQYAISHSIQTLINVFSEYYPMVPLPRELATHMTNLPEYIQTRRLGKKPETSHTPMNQIQSTLLMKEVIEILDTDFKAGRLYLYVMDKRIPPLVSLSIDSKIAKHRRTKNFEIRLGMPDRKWRRSKVLGIPPSSTAVINEATQSQHIRSLMMRDDECSLAEENDPALDHEFAASKTLLPEELFGWASAGQDRLNIELNPSLETIDNSLRTLAKAPLKNLQLIKMLKRDSLEQGKLRAGNAKSALHCALKEVSIIFQYSLYGPMALLAILRHFEYLFTPDPKALYEKIIASHVDDYAGFVQEIETIEKHKDMLEHNLPKALQFGIFEVDLTGLKAEGIRNAELLMDNLLQELRCEHLGILREIHASYDSLLSVLSRSPESVEDLGYLQDFLTEKKDEEVTAHISKELESVQFISDSLERFQKSMGDEQSVLWWKTKSWGLTTKREKRRLQKRLQKMIPSLQEEVQRHISEMKAMVTGLKTDIADFINYNDVQKADIYAGKASDIIQILDKLKSGITLASSREKRLGYTQTNFSDVFALEEQFTAFNEFWTFASEWAFSYMTWMEKPLHFIDPMAVIRKFSRGKQLLQALGGELYGNPNVMQAIEDLKEQIRSFENTVPLISDLREEALRDRHWKKIWDSLGRVSSDKPDQERKESQTLRELLFQGILRHAKAIEAIAFEARKEFEIEQRWAKIEKEIRNPTIEIVSHSKHEELRILARLDDMRGSLHEYYTTITFLNSTSRYVDPFKDVMKNLLSTINTQKTMLDDIHDFQSMLIELFPVFKIREMCEQLPRTTEQMRVLVMYYARQLKFMQDVRNRQTHNFATSNEGAVKTLSDASAQLKAIKEDVQKKVAEKQSQYSRLFFLSDIEIMTLMSSVRPKGTIDMSIIFPGIEEVRIEENRISEVVRDGSVLELAKKVVVIQESGSPRNIDEWLTDLDSSLKDLHSKRVLSLFTQFSSSRLPWDSEKDSEAVYIAYLVWFSHEMQDILQGESVLEQLKETLNILKTTLVTGIKGMTPSHGTPGHGNVLNAVMNQFHKARKSSGQRQSNEMLVHLLISHIDFLQRLLTSAEIDFSLQWKSVFKLTPAVVNPDSKESMSLNVACFDYVMSFGFEMHSLNYLQFFILTPASEKRLLHLYLTLKHSLGGMLAGPPGSEKTETLKHLAVMCGRLLQICYVTSTMTLDKVVKFVAGCALGGFWGCMDEIRSLPEIYLCTVTHYIRTVLSAPLQSRVTLDCYQFKSKPGFTMFCTSSVPDPQLPGTFHELFRVLSVTKPDLSTIATILMMTYGFHDAERYGRMIAKGMELLQQPILSLSTAVSLHLRIKANTKTLIRLVRVMISIAQTHYINDMAYLINNTFRQIYGLGLLSTDLEVLDEFLSTLFQAGHNDIVSQIDYRSAAEEIGQVLIAEKVIAIDAMQRRCQHLWCLLYEAKRSWVFVVGKPLSGKSEVIRLLSKVAASVLNINFQIHTLGAAAPPELLSSLHEYLTACSNPWFSPNPPTSFSSNSVLPDDRLVCSSKDWIRIDFCSLPYTTDALLSATRNDLNSDLKLIMEVETLDAADPAVVSEAGILYVTDTDIDLDGFYTICMREILPLELKEHFPTLEKLFHLLLVPVIAYLDTADVTLRLPQKLEIQQFSNLLKPYLKILARKIQKEAEMEILPLTKAANSLLLVKRSATYKHEREEKLTRANTILNPLQEIKSSVLKYVGGVRKTVTHLKPQLCLEAIYTLSLVNALGNLVVNKDGFANMISRILSNQPDDFAYFLSKELAEHGSNSISDLVFSMKTFAWSRFLSSYGDGENPSVGQASHSHRRSLSFYEASSSRLNILSLNQSRHNLLIGTESTRRLAHWVEFCLHYGTDFLVFGPHESGKSSVTLAVAKNFLSHSSCGLVPFNVSEFTTAYAVQDCVQSAMEHCRNNVYGGLGGKRYFAVLDDMNMDTSNQLYELFRFWKETHGWYSEGFATISDLTVALVHSYTEGTSPPLWLRAIRHFFLLHKEAYSQVELTSIFRKHVDSTAGDEAPPVSDMLSVPEESVIALVSLFRELQLQQKKSEKLWCHITISNFTLALKFFSQFELNDEIDIPTYLKLWSFMYSRFFTDQLGNVSDQYKEIRSIMTENLQNLIYKFVEEDEVIEQILEEGFIIPSHWELKNVSAENFKDVGPVDTESIGYVVSQFHASHEACVRLYPNLLKYLHALVLNIESRFSVFYYFYLTLLYDIKSSCPSVIIKSDSQMLLIKALVYIAAETLKMKVFELGAGDWEDGFAEQMIQSFRQVSPHHIPTEIRFAVKHIVEEAMILNKRTLIVVSLRTVNQLDRPLSRRIMEIANDIMTGVQLRLTGFSSYYSEFIDTFRAQHADPSVQKQHFNDEILQMMLDRMRLNTTIVFLVNSKEGSWIRSPLHPIGILEKLKHEYRSIFNKSRIVDFDNLNPPQAFVTYIRKNPEVLESWKLSFNNALLDDIGEKVSKIAKISALDEYAYECIVYCSAKLLKDARTHKSVMKSTLSRAIRQIEILQESVESSGQRIVALGSEAKRLETRLDKLRKKLSFAETEFTKNSTQDFPSIFTTLIQEQRQDFSAVFAAERSAWEHTIEEFLYRTEDVRDVEKALGSSPMIVRLMYLLHVLINQVETAAAPEDMMESAVRKLTPQLSKKAKEISKNLKKIEAETIPDLSAGLREIELGGRLPKLVKATYGVIGAAQTLREARMRLGAQEKELDERLKRVPEEVEAKVKELRENQTAKVAKIQEKINRLQGRLTQIFLDIDQIGISKPKLTKLLTDLHGSSDAWLSALPGTEENESDLGDSVLCSFMLLKGMGLPYDTRCVMVQSIMETMRKHGYVCRPQCSLSLRLIQNHRSFDCICARFCLPDSVFFKDNAAAIQTVFQLNLPFPGIYDPYEIAVDFIEKLEAENGLLVGKVTNDTAFERKLREAVVEGRPVLCIDPSTSLARALIPILTWKVQMFVAQMRGMDAGLLKLPTLKSDLKVHPKFRFYLCFKTLPSTEIQQLMTLINFDAVDKESWESFVFLPLLKLLDDHQHQLYSSQTLRQQEQILAMEDAEMEILTLLTQNDMDAVITSESLLDKLNRAWRKMRLLPMEEEGGNRRRSSVFTMGKEKPGAVEIRIIPVTTGEPKVSPKEKLKSLLAEMFGFKQVLYMCNPGLKDYAVSGKLLHMMIMNSVLEYIRTIAIPLESQWESFAECMTYRVFVRICQSLPTDKRLLFTAFYTFFKHYETNQIPRKEYLLVMDDVAKCVEHPQSQSENLDYLKTKYPQLFPPHFCPGTVAFSLFMTRDLYKDAKLPDTFFAIHRYLLYAYLRPDLLPDFIRHITEEILGPRFDWVPRIDFDIYYSDSVKLPTVVFFQETSPIAMLRYMAEARNVTLISTQPLYVSTDKASRQETRHSHRLTESVIAALAENLNSSRWVTIENLQTVTGLEAEVLTKFLIYKVAEEASETLRIWILLQGRPEQYPQWGNLVKQCQRIVIPEPVKLKEQMLLWHYANKSAFFIHYRTYINKRYYEHCSLEGGVLERSVQRKVSKKLLAMMVLQEAAEELKHRGIGIDQKQTLAFNAAVLFSILYFRTRYHSDLSDLWKRGDARMLFDEFLSYLPVDTVPEDLFRPALLSLFCTLLTPQLEKYATATVISLMRQVFYAEKHVLEVKSQDQNQPFSAIEYPLYQLEHLELDQNLEILINRFPVEDHILVTGLGHHHTLTSRLQEAKVLLELLTTLHHSLEGELILDYSTYLTNEKKTVSEGLQRFLNELLDAIPSVIEQRTIAGKRFYSNAFLKPEHASLVALASTKDGFKLSDMRNSVLDSPPRLEDVMEVLELAEGKLCNEFLVNVRMPLMEMSRYLTYSRPTISTEHMKDLVELANNRVPTHWLDLSPYVSRHARSADEWQKELISLFRKQVIWTEIDLSLLFAPSLVLQTILRAASISTGQHFEQMCFEMAFGDAAECDPRKFQIAIRGLFIANARINRETGVLEDHEVGEELSTLVLTPTTEPEDVRDCPEYPEGLKLIGKKNSEINSPEEDDASSTGGFTPESKTSSSGTKPLVFFPVMIASPVLWMMVPGKKTQGHWSKRGVLVRLGESSYI